MAVQVGGRTVKLTPLTLLTAVSLMLGACGDTTASRTVSGGLMGAAGGAAIGAIAGNAGLGAAVGAGAGLLGGYLYDQHKKGNIDY
jgi:Glycine-zipper domain